MTSTATAITLQRKCLVFMPLEFIGSNGLLAACSHDGHEHIARSTNRCEAAGFPVAGGNRPVLRSCNFRYRRHRTGPGPASRRSQAIGSIQGRHNPPLLLKGRKGICRPSRKCLGTRRCPALSVILCSPSRRSFFAEEMNEGARGKLADTRVGPHETLSSHRRGLCVP